MNPNDSTYPTPEDLVALRVEEDPVRVISEKLKVKEMGPADHIRTKHEVKAFIGSAGDMKEAEGIIARARARRALQETHETTIKVAENQRQGH